MAFNNSFTAVTGATYTAAQYNTYTRDNMTAIWVYTTAGDLAYASSSTTLSRLGIGSSGSLLRSTGSAPAWLAAGTNYQFLQMASGAPAWGGVHFASVYHNTTQSIGSGFATAIVFNSEYSDSQGWHSTSSNTDRITVGSAGYYMASCYVYYTTGGGSGTYLDEIALWRDGSPIMYDRRYQEVSAYSKIFSITFPIISASASSYFQIVLTQASGQSATVAANSMFSMWRIA